MKIRISVFTLLFLCVNLACGVTTALPTTESTAQVFTISQPATARPMATTEANTVHTLGTVNIRVCPSTSCEVIGQAHEGQTLEVGKLVENQVIDCPRWYPVIWEGHGAFICAEWTSK